MTFRTPVGRSTTELQETRGSLDHTTRFIRDKLCSFEFCRTFLSILNVTTHGYYSTFPTERFSVQTNVFKSPFSFGRKRSKIFLFTQAFSYLFQLSTPMCSRLKTHTFDDTFLPIVHTKTIENGVCVFKRLRFHWPSLKTMRFRQSPLFKAFSIVSVIVSVFDRLSVDDRPQNTHFQTDFFSVLIVCFLQNGDAFMNRIQDMAAWIPYMTCVGNHGKN